MSIIAHPNGIFNVFNSSFTDHDPQIVDIVLNCVDTYLSQVQFS